MSKFLYFDYASTTPVDQRVVLAMEPYWYRQYGNPSSLHQLGVAAKEILEDCRQSISQLLDMENGKIIFTSGGTESDNLAIIGSARTRMTDGNHIIVSAIEHKAVLKAAKYLVKEGWQVDFCPVGPDGTIDQKKLADLIKKETVLVSVIYANNEIGTVQDLSLIARIIKRKNDRIWLHTDACQAMNYLEISPEKLGVDLMTFNASKCYGPKGVGGLWIREGVKIEPMIFGGGQEFGWRSGTENIPLIVGMAEAIKLARRVYREENRRLVLLKRKIVSTVQKSIPDAVLNSNQKESLPNIINFSFPGAEGESVVLYLDSEGIGVSTGSACSASDLDPSHVLLAIGLSSELAHTSLRISLGRWTSDGAVDILLDKLPAVIGKVRQMSAL